MLVVVDHLTIEPPPEWSRDEEAFELAHLAQVHVRALSQVVVVRVLGERVPLDELAVELADKGLEPVDGWLRVSSAPVDEGVVAMKRDPHRNRGAPCGFERERKPERDLTSEERDGK